MISLKEKLTAAGTHLLLSCLVAALVFCLVYFVWYPAPLAVATGIGSIFLLLLFVDLSIGPLLTGIVYKKGKKSLRFDLSIIVIFQLIALAYGLWTIGHARPAWIVYNAGRFDLVQAHEIDSRFQERVAPEFRFAPWTGPRWIASRNPENQDELNQLIFESAMGGPDLPQRSDLFVPLETEWKNIIKKSHALKDLEKFNPIEKIQPILKKYPSATAWLPLMARAQPMVVLIDKSLSEHLAVIDLAPWD